MKNLLKFSLIAAAAALVSSAPAFAGISIIHNAPEPATILLLASGVGAVAVLRRYRTKA